MPEASPSQAPEESLATSATAEPQAPSRSVDRRMGLEAQAAKEKEWLKCPICNKRFVKQRKWHEFCSKKCKNKNFWKTHKVMKVVTVDA